ncbi:MAG: DUF1092 family protein [Symploca sp. SIO1C4]|uniref:DUF1092 family protein n=1 Tax=Symploca sp. SIO1C4 TaxID=2607765 RepID=A0A6B3NNQ6_9CYAN|nr:DUF1092 family protein [Symploca sp. SIO1C4]
MGIIWELDFYSRPILDENRKKLWEVLICESPLHTCQSTENLFQYSQLCPNQQVNSIWLREALATAIAQAQTPPSKIRFFRRQMNNMITKACQELNIPAQATRRTYTLERWLQQRLKDFYPHQPGYEPTAIASASVSYSPQTPQPLPDALQGDKWTFVSLEAAAFEEMDEWEIDFGEAFSLSRLKIEPDARIPGIIIFSARAKPLAGWMSGLELAFVRLDSGDIVSENSYPPRILLETGASESWILDQIKDPQILAEAKGFESAKEKVEQVHFIAVQSSPTSETFAGFWLLQEIK